MTYAIGQLTVTLAPGEANPGMLADNGFNDVVSFQAGEIIQPGRAVEIIAANAVDSVPTIRMVQDTGNAALAIVGVSVLDTARENPGSADLSTYVGGAAYAIGDMVRVLKKGRIYMEWKGTTQVLGKMNVYHSSTLAVDRGKLTDAGAASTSGAEISVGPQWISVEKVMAGTGSVALVSVNAPGGY